MSERQTASAGSLPASALGQTVTFTEPARGTKSSPASVVYEEVVIYQIEHKERQTTLYVRRGPWTAFAFLPHDHPIEFFMTSGRRKTHDPHRPQPGPRG